MDDQRNTELFAKLAHIVTQDTEPKSLLNDIASILFNSNSNPVSENTFVDLCKLCYQKRELDLLRQLLTVLIPDSTSEPDVIGEIQEPQDINVSSIQAAPEATHENTMELIDASPTLSPLSEKFIQDVFSRQLCKRNGEPYPSRSLQVNCGHLTRFIRALSTSYLFSHSHEQIQEFFMSIRDHDNVRKSLKESENWLTGLLAVTRNVKNDDFFIVKYFGSIAHFNDISSLLEKIMKQVLVAQKDFEKTDPQLVRSNEFHLLKPWNEFKELVSRYVDTVINIDISQCSTEVLQVATFMSLSVLDNEPRRNEYVILSTLPGTPFHPFKPQLNENWYNDGHVVLNWFKTVNPYGPYCFQVSHNTRVLLDELVS